MSRTPAPGVPTPITEDVTGVGRVPFHSDGEAQIYRDVRDLRKQVRGFGDRLGRVEVGVGEIRGGMTTLLAMQRTKAPSSDPVAKALLADKLDEGRVRRRWWLSAGKTVLKVIGGVLLVLLGRLLA